MAAIQKAHGPRLPRSESLQKMLDLEKQFKLARIQGQPSPSSPALSTMTVQTQAQAAPLQTRHRESLSSLSLQSQQQSSIPTTAHRPGHVSPLAISIPIPAEDAGDDDDAKSEQSSICQSPSWEGYGQKKKDKDKKKKQEAEQQRRDKSKPSPDPRALATRRTTNRLFKTPRPDSTEPNRTRPPVSMPAGRTTPSGHRSLIPEAWSGQTSQPLARPPVPRSTSAIPDQQNKTTSKGKGTAKADSKGAHEKAYPPLSSRSYALRQSLLPVHTRQKSAPSLAAAAGGGLLDEQTRTPKDNYLYATKNKSDQSVDYTPEPAVMRGRQSAEPMLTSTSTSASTSAALGGYVRQARAQSIERSIKGFMQEAALSDPNLLNAPNRMAFSYIGPRKTEEQDVTQRPSSSQSKMRAGRSGDTNDDYFTLENTNAQPGLDPGTPSSGILSSIKSRISRRSSISSGSTSHTGKSFRERAMGAMHLQTNAPTASNTSDVGSLPSKKPSQNPSQLGTSTASTDSGVASASAATTQSVAPTRHRDTEKEKDGRLLPKAARVLGEINQQTMAQGRASHSRPSEGSSVSSCHEDTSVPPSPASTPDTSRPQSTKDMAAPIDGAVGGTVRQGRKTSMETLSADPETSLTDGLGILDEAWSQSTVAADNDAQSFVTTLTNQKSAASLRSQAGILSLKEAALLADHDLGTHPALKDDDSAKKRRLSRLMAAVKEEPSRDARDANDTQDREGHEMPSEPVKANAATPTRSAVYLQEARWSARMVASPLSQAIRSAKTLSAIVARGDGVDAGTSATTSATTSTLPTPPVRVPPEMLHLQLPPKQPMAKMLVECCHCKFFHDMPSRVYECMAQPDAVVTDSELGVSGAITTMVKCPWCAHNMSTACCAGYAAVVYLKERLH